MRRPAAVTGRNPHGFAIWGEVCALTGRDCGRVSRGRKVVVSRPRRSNCGQRWQRLVENRRGILTLSSSSSKRGLLASPGEGAGVVGERGRQEKEEDRTECSQVRSAACPRLVVAVGGPKEGLVPLSCRRRPPSRPPTSASRSRARQRTWTPTHPPGQPAGPADTRRRQPSPLCGRSCQGPREPPGARITGRQGDEAERSEDPVRPSQVAHWFVRQSPSHQTTPAQRSTYTEMRRTLF